MEKTNATIEIRELPPFDGQTLLIRNTEEDTYTAIEISDSSAELIRGLFQ